MDPSISSRWKLQRNPKLVPSPVLESVALALCLILGAAPVTAATSYAVSPLFHLDTTIQSFDDSPLFHLNTMTGVSVGVPPAGRIRDFRVEPNPFNPSTTLRFELTAPANVTLGIHDARGRRIRTLIHAARLGTGAHEFIWRGRDEAGRTIASGVYYCSLKADGEIRSEAITVLK